MLLLAHRQYHDFSKGGQLCWLIGFYPDNGLKKEDIAPLLQVSRIGVSVVADGYWSHLPARETRLFQVLLHTYQLIEVKV